MIFIGTSLPGSPFTLKQPDAWFFGTPKSPSLNTLLPTILVYAGIILLLHTWYSLYQLSKQQEISFHQLKQIFILWSLPLLLIPPFLSRDIYSYVAQGDMFTHGISPFYFGPGVLASSPFTFGVDPLWINTPAPYGPLFIILAGWIVNISAHHVLVSIFLMRLLDFAGVALLAVYLPKLAELEGFSPTKAFILGVLNPVTLLDLIAGGHNDSIMLGLFIAGIYLARSKHTIWGIIVVTLAAYIKIPAELGVVYIGWFWLGDNTPIANRIRPLVTAGLISLGIMTLISYTSTLGWEWVLNLSAPTAVVSWVSPITDIGVLLSKVVIALGVPVHSIDIINFVRSLGLIAFSMVAVLVFKNSHKIGFILSMAITFTAVVFLGPVIQPWYLSWGLITFAIVDKEVIHKVVIGLTLFASVIGTPTTTVLSSISSQSPIDIILTIIVIILSFVWCKNTPKINKTISISPTADIVQV